MLKPKTIATVLLFLTLTALFGACSMKNLPTGELIDTHTSPNGAYTLNIYLCNGGATVAYAIRGELVDEKGKAKNIFWQYRSDSAEVEWLNDETVIINGKQLNVLKDVYDYREDDDFYENYEKEQEELLEKNKNNP